MITDFDPTSDNPTIESYWDESTINYCTDAIKSWSIHSRTPEVSCEKLTPFQVIWCPNENQTTVRYPQTKLSDKEIAELDPDLTHIDPPDIATIVRFDPSELDREIYSYWSKDTIEECRKAKLEWQSYYWENAPKPIVPIPHMILWNPIIKQTKVITLDPEDLKDLSGNNDNVTSEQSDDKNDYASKIPNETDSQDFENSSDKTSDTIPKSNIQIPPEKPPRNIDKNRESFANTTSSDKEEFIDEH